MCGICGLLSKTEHSFDAGEVIKRMCDSMAHRGPDGEGRFSSKGIEMGMRRLSIIDLKGGWQPLYNEDKTVAVMANGEIYNFIELRKELEAKGHVFRTKSDCETIAHLYEDDGIDFVKRLRGMFAIALWDQAKEQLVLARDRMGEKPLYIFECDDFFLFSSELKGVLKSGVVPFKLDNASINLYFHYNYVVEPYTVIKDVFKLPPAHVLTLDKKTNKSHLHRYWDMQDAPILDGPADTILLDSIRDTMSIISRSDVPIGLALSGGIDSSLIGALSREMGLKNMNAISVGYQGTHGCDERCDAYDFSQEYDLQFHSVEITNQELVCSFPELVYWLDDPVSDVSAYGYYSLMKKAKELGVPVLLQGHGGDELFWGYPWVKNGSQLSADKSRQLLDSGEYKPGDAAAMVFIDQTLPFHAAQEALHIYFTEAFLADVKNGPNVYQFFEHPLPWLNTDTDMTRLICGIYLVGNGIVQGDRLGMASSIEQRLPLIDYTFVEKVIGLRKHKSDQSLPPKSRLIEALQGVLPDSILKRPKRGFAPPLDEWMRALRQEFGKTILNGELVQEGIIRPKLAKELLEDRHLKWRGAPIFYKMLVLEHWIRAMKASLAQVPSMHQPHTACTGEAYVNAY